MSHYPLPLTIDFTDASFDNDSITNPVAPDNVDVVFPIVDNPVVLDAGGAAEKTGFFINDTRTSNTAAQSIALTPTGSTEDLMEEFLFEFDNDMNDDTNTTTGDTGLRVSMAGSRTGSGGEQQVKSVVIDGPIDNLTGDGTLNVHVPSDYVDANNNNQRDANEPIVYQKIQLGIDSNNNSGNDTAMFVSGDTDGGNMGSGNDTAMINVDASATMSGMYQGGSGYDILQLVEGVAQDNGALVDFTRGRNANEAEVDNYGGEGNSLFFEVGGFEEIRLTDNADVIKIAGSTGGSDLTTFYDAVYMNPGLSNSVFKVMTGFTDGGLADTVYVDDANSRLYLSFEFSKEIGVNATFSDNGNVDIVNMAYASGQSGPDIDVNVIANSATANKMTVDYFEGTSSQDIITNNNDIGVTVDLNGAGANKAYADIFTGSSTSSNDVLDAREAYDLEFSAGNTSGYIHVKGDSEIDQTINADLKSVDYIMVRDHAMTGTVTDARQIWDQVGTDDVDFYEDMTHLIGSQIVDSLGSGATDDTGLGYDVITSAQVDSFSTYSDLRVYYEGDHGDFTDIDDVVTSVEGSFVMSAGDSSRGSAWEGQIDALYDPGMDPGFYIEVGAAGYEKKLAVTFDEVKNAWKVDTTAIQVAEGASSAISGPSSTSTPEGIPLANAISEQFGIALKPTADHTQTFISNDILLNATEDAVKDLMANGTVSLKASNFDFYTQVKVEAADGPVTVNVKLGANDANTAFTLDLTDIDVAVESFHNVVDVTGAGVSSSSEAGEFVKIDNAADIALGNGGDDTYVVGADPSTGIYGGTALEYGNIDTYGGLTGSIDAINFNSVDSVAKLDFVRTKTRQEADGNTLEISQANGLGGTTVLFDNYNEFLDFRRVEYLSVEDGANNDEIYEIVTNKDDNIADWDNEIYVSHATETSMDVELGGIDYVIGATGSKDTFNFKLADIISAGSDTSVVNLSKLSSADGDTLVAKDASTYMDDTDKGLLEAALAQGISDGVSQVRFSYNDTTDKLTLGLDNLPDVTYDLDVYSS